MEINPQFFWFNRKVQESPSGAKRIPNLSFSLLDITFEDIVKEIAVHSSQKEIPALAKEKTFLAIGAPLFD